MPTDDSQTLPYLPPEWVLIAGHDPFVSQADVAVHTEDDTLTVRIARDEPTICAYLAKRPPTVALVDLDAGFGERAIAELTRSNVPVIALSYSQERLDAIRGVSTYVQKPFSNKGLAKVVNGVVGRR
jgi:DNA-binding response OmpR family regulator